MKIYNRSIFNTLLKDAHNDVTKAKRTVDDAVMKYYSAELHAASFIHPKFVRDELN